MFSGSQFVFCLVFFKLRPLRFLQVGVQVQVWGLTSRLVNPSVLTSNPLGDHFPVNLLWANSMHLGHLKNRRELFAMASSDVENHLWNVYLWFYMILLLSLCSKILPSQISKKTRKSQGSWSINVFFRKEFERMIHFLFLWSISPPPNNPPTHLINNHKGWDSLLEMEQSWWWLLLPEG